VEDLARHVEILARVRTEIATRVTPAMQASSFQRTSRGNCSAMVSNSPPPLFSSARNAPRRVERHPLAVSPADLACPGITSA
jgi:hypothetical protein